MWEEDVKKAFEKNISPEPNSGCWIWLGGILKRGGYGSFNHRPSKTWMVRAHRMAWKLYRDATITKEDHVLHKCDNPICVNPDHLFIGDQALNMEDKSYKGRQLQGKNHPKYIHGRYIGDKKNPKYA
jgi:hypothetical protein